MPKIFNSYDKLIYLDCDMLILRDIKELFDIDIGDNYVGAIRDKGALYRSVSKNLDEYNYCCVILGLEGCESYFNAGCMVCNIKKMREDNLTEKLIEKLCEIKNPRFNDQCILNTICKGKVKYISDNWNFETYPLFYKDFVSNLPDPYKDHYISAGLNPYIIHYAASVKPWTNPSLQKSDIWWQYARMMPFYEEILYKNLRQQQPNLTPIKNELQQHARMMSSYEEMLHKNLLQQQSNSAQIKNAINYNKNRWKYWQYKVLSKITFGKIRKKYKEKREIFKKKLRQAREFLKK
jgi:lipopolysaccharide biosynthesis glycosyltransferase